MSNIKVGDVVAVNFFCVERVLASRAEVVCIPKAAGESWVFKLLGGFMYYKVDKSGWGECTS